MDATCVCGHVDDEHGSCEVDPPVEGCCVDECECPFFEDDGMSDDVAAYNETGS